MEQLNALLFLTYRLDIMKQSERLEQFLQKRRASKTPRKRDFSTSNTERNSSTPHGKKGFSLTASPVASARPQKLHLASPISPSCVKVIIERENQNRDASPEYRRVLFSEAPRELHKSIERSTRSESKVPTTVTSENSILPTTTLFNDEAESARTDSISRNLLSDLDSVSAEKSFVPMETHTHTPSHVSWNRARNPPHTSPAIRTFLPDSRPLSLNLSNESVARVDTPTTQKIETPEIVKAEVASDKHASPIRGMENQGNRCYLNSLLVAIRSDPALYAWVMGEPNDSTLSPTIRGEIKKIFQETFVPTGDPVSLRALIMLLGKQMPIFRSRRQQDVHEAFTVLLSLLIEEEDKLMKESSLLDKADVDGSHGSQPEKETPTLSHLLQMEIENSIKCDECHHQVSVVEKSTMLSLPVEPGYQSNGNTTDTSLPPLCLVLEQLVRKVLCEKEYIQHACESCGATRALSTLSPLTLPQVLVLHLKRFDASGRKIVREVFTTPRILLYTKADGAMYEFRSMISHVGDHVTSGHYICDFQAHHSDTEVFPTRVGHGDDTILLDTMTQDDGEITSGSERGVPMMETLGLRERKSYLIFYTKIGNLPPQEVIREVTV